MIQAINFAGIGIAKYYLEYSGGPIVWQYGRALQIWLGKKNKTNRRVISFVSCHFGRLEYI